MGGSDGTHFHKAKRVAVSIGDAQWSDVGPGRSDHWQYVFGNELPKQKGKASPGLSVSPAVRDFLGLQDSDVTDWKFVEARDVPIGPWARLGANNSVLARIRRSPAIVPPADPANASSAGKPTIVHP